MQIYMAETTNIDGEIMRCWDFAYTHLINLFDFEFKKKVFTIHLFQSIILMVLLHRDDINVNNSFLAVILFKMRKLIRKIFNENFL